MSQRSLEIHDGATLVFLGYEGDIERSNDKSVISALEGWDSVRLEPVELRQKTGSLLMRLNNESKEIRLDLWTQKPSNSPARFENALFAGRTLRFRRTYMDTGRRERLVAVLTSVEIEEHPNDYHILVRALCMEPIKEVGV